MDALIHFTLKSSGSPFGAIELQKVPEV